MWPPTYYYDDGMPADYQGYNDPGHEDNDVPSMVDSERDCEESE